MSTLRVKLDNFIPNSQVDGLEELTANVDFAYTSRTLLVTPNDIDLVFTGDGYAYLLESKKTNGYNGVHDIAIQKQIEKGTFKTIYVGTIFIADCKFDLDRHFCRVDAVDNGYQSYIKNNIDISTVIEAGKTKNREEITSPVANEVYLINPPSNTIPAVGLVTTTAFMYDVRDVFNYLVGFLSDNKLTYESNHLDGFYDGNDNTIFGLTTGRMLRDSANTETIKDISFQTLWKAISQLLNMVLTIDSSTGSAVVRLEELGYFRNTEIIAKKEAVAGIIQGYAQTLLFSRATLGSNDSETDGTVGAFPYTPPVDFKKDNYYVSGVGNADGTLDLSSAELITDTNIIEDIIVNDNDSHDDTWFLVVYRWNDTTSQFEALTDKSQIHNNGNYYYNGELTNKAVVGRYNFQGATVKISGDSAYDFLGAKGLGTVSNHVGAPAITQLAFGSGFGNILTGNFDEVFQDPAGSWNTGTSRYTATASGMRNFSLIINHRVKAEYYYANVPSWQTPVWTIKVRFKLNGNYIEGTRFVPPVLGYPSYVGEDADRLFTLGNYDPSQQAFSQVRPNVNIYMETSDYLEVEVGVNIATINKGLVEQSGWEGQLLSETPFGWSTLKGLGDATLIASGTIEVLGSSTMEVKTDGSTNGAELGSNVKTSATVNKFTFTDILTDKEMTDFLNSPHKSISLNNQEHNINARTWAKSVSIKLGSGKTEFETINNIDNL